MSALPTPLTPITVTTLSDGNRVLIVGLAVYRSPFHRDGPVKPELGSNDAGHEKDGFTATKTLCGIRSTRCSE